MPAEGFRVTAPVYPRLGAKSPVTLYCVDSAGVVAGDRTLALDAQVDTAVERTMGDSRLLAEQARFIGAIQVGSIFSLQ
jgi:hypothetical protein